MLNLIIDRVGNVNIFNFLDSNSIGPESHIHSKMDTDLILEFLREVESVSRISRTFLTASVVRSEVKPDILRDLKAIGETFFDQFFPAEIANKIRSSSDRFLHFNIDQGLKDIPWELLYDGREFLADKFFIGRTVKGAARQFKEEGTKKMKMLIIADPTEDLEWAQREGETLFQVLREKISSNNLELQFVAGRQITKLKLLSMIKGKNIIHYAGHLFFSEDALENGWLLSDGKVLKAREISNSGTSASLVFSNSCQSSRSAEISPSIMSYFAGSFLLSGIKCFVGTNWEIADNERTLDFTIRFYQTLFQHKSVGEALYFAREFARRNYESWDLTWANYTLHGSPALLMSPKGSESRSKASSFDMIQFSYPMPIAKSFMKFVSEDKSGSDALVLLKLLAKAFEDFSKMTGAVIFSDHSRQSLGKISVPEDKEIGIRKWWDMIYAAMWDFKKLEISMVMGSMMDILYTHRDMINKIVDWIDKLQKGQLEEEFIQGYLVTFQYYFENILLELREFEETQLCYIPPNSHEYFSFSGTEPKYLSVLQDFNPEQAAEMKEKVIFYHKSTNIYVELIGLKITGDSNSVRLELENSYNYSAILCS